MKCGKIIRSFSAKDGREVVLRTPKWEDIDDCLELINSLVDEKANILRTEKVSREEEIDWLSKVLSSLEKDEMFHLVAQVNGKVVAVSDMIKRTGYEKHVGLIGIGIKSDYRNLGIGTEIMKTLVDQARKMGLKVLTLKPLQPTNERFMFTRKLGLCRRTHSKKAF